MKLLTVPLAFLAISTTALADPLARQYAMELVHQNLKIPETELEFSEWRQSVPGGYILRFAFDVDADGMPERFLASSFNADDLICDWMVYEGASGELMGQATSLRPDGFWWNPVSREMLDYVRFGAEGGLANFSHFGKSGLTTRNEPAALDEVIAGLGREDSPRQGFQRVKPDVSISLLADVVANGDLGWRPLILDDAGNNYSLPNGRLLLTEDAPLIEALRDFTPKAAFAAMQKLQAESGQPSKNSPMPSGLPNVRSSSTPMPDEVTTSTPSQKPSSSTPRSVVALLIGAAVVLLLWLLKIRTVSKHN